MVNVVERFSRIWIIDWKVNKVKRGNKCVEMIKYKGLMIL